MYVKCGEVDVAHDIFERTPPVKDAVSWNSMISGYASKGMWSKLFDTMRATGAEMDIITWNTIAGGCLKTGNFIGSLKLFSQIRTCGIQLEPVATLIGLGACSHTGLLKTGSIVIRSHLDDFDNVRNALINMYARCKALKQAHILFQFVDSKTVITWTTIISGFAHWDRICANLIKHSAFPDAVEVDDSALNALLYAYQHFHLPMYREKLANTLAFDSCNVVVLS
ncbi:hypothetical protein K7X08_005231 [Anisodus acutangulus]|uniref:Pentatricopeptide repeat-containing protein n=1 Tax=Anisodus acutangulus TaxID=402998 RepID=A0A9Q1RJ86_9SOLA|nr:hypothetical protein K7X08_005231 [Anisodus acutangulus]